MKVTWDQVLAWRLRRQYLAPRTDAGVQDVVGRLCGVQAQVASAAEMAVALRRVERDPDGIAGGLADGSLIKTWAMRGTLHLLRSADCGAYLSLIAAARFWAKPIWQRTYGATVETVDRLTELVAGLLDGRVLTRDELVRAIVADPRFTAMEEHLRSGWGSLLKPLAWQGVLCFGPSQGANVTFTAPASLAPGWRGLPDPDEAGPPVVEAYLGAFGPGTPDAFDTWLTRNMHRKTRIRGWFQALGERITEVDIEGHRAFVCSAHVDEIAAIEPTDTVRLLGPFDQYVLGPGTSDVHILPSRHRAKVSRTAGWISPLVVMGGRIVGVWATVGEELQVSMFDGKRAPAARRLTAEAALVSQAGGKGRLRVRVV